MLVSLDIGFKGFYVRQNSLRLCLLGNGIGPAV